MKNNDIFKKDGFKGEWMYVLPTEAFTEYVNHPIVERLYLTDIGYFPKALHHFRERTEGISENIYIYCMDGEGTIELADGQIFHLNKGQAFCIPANTGHKYYTNDNNPWSILWLHFKGSDCSFYPLNRLAVAHFDAGDSDARMLALFTQLYHILGQSYTLGNFITITGIISVILSTTYLRNPEENRNNLITRVIRYMYSNLNRHFTLSELSAEFKISPSYLSRQFKENTGRSPIEFFNKIKMDEACKLLSSTDLHVNEISLRLGIEDPYYFSRLFKKITGCSPRNYRKR